MTNPSDRSRKMKALFAGVDPVELATLSSTAVKPVRDRVSAGAVKSMRGAFSAIEVENEQLRKQLNSAETVIELDPDQVDPSFVNDRLEEDKAEEFQTLVVSIRDFGQQVPILARPHPDAPGRFQLAYGHRRWRACRHLGRTVRAIVQELTDEALIISQGKENTERRNLSFMEMAMFASSLKQRGFDRKTIANALGRQEDREVSYISILTGIAEALPERLVRAIGPAPRSGRPKWEKLAREYGKGNFSLAKTSPVGKLISSADWKAADSDSRLTMILQLITDKPDLPQEEASPYGIKVRHAGTAASLSFQHDQAPELVEWLAQRLPDLIATFEKAATRKK